MQILSFLPGGVMTKTEPIQARLNFKMSEAWLTRTQSQGELDTASSVSLVRSIYGSQVSCTYRLASTYW